MWKYVIELGKTDEVIVHGEPIPTTTWTQVFANKKSVKQSEFYQAAVAGLKPELVFEVNSFEFDNHDKVRYPATDGKEYQIIRVYDRGEITELTVSSRVGSEV